MSFWEFSVIIIVGLLVVGPARLPEAIKTGYTWFTRIKHSINQVRVEFEQQIGADDIRRDLHNEQVLKSLNELKAIKEDIEKSAAKQANQLTLDHEGDPHDTPTSGHGDLADQNPHAHIDDHHQENSISHHHSSVHHADQKNTPSHNENDEQHHVSNESSLPNEPHNSNKTS